MRNELNKLIIPLVAIGVLILVVTVLIPLRGESVERKGQRLYEMHCGNCHRNDGSGLRLLIPKIDALHPVPAKDLVCLIKWGSTARGSEKKSFELKMPPNHQLQIGEITLILNFVQKRFYGVQDAEQATPADVAQILKRCQ
jgi:mono/diheme cytochrome c family protein